MFQKVRILDLSKRWDVKPRKFERRSSAGPTATQVDDTREFGTVAGSSNMGVGDAFPAFVSTLTVAAMTGGDEQFASE